MKGKIESLGKNAQIKAIKLSVGGQTYQAIADQLSEEYNTELTSDNIQSFVTRNKQKSINLLKEDKKLQTKFAETYFDTIKQLTDVNSEIWKLFYEIRKTPEKRYVSATCSCGKKVSIEVENYASLLKAAEVILKQIEHVDKVMGKLKQKSYNINYNYVDLSKKISFILPKLLNNMEKQGIVKVNKKRLKLYSGGEKMTYDENEDFDLGEEEQDEDENDEAQE